jgi:hypothetical protein
MKRATFYRIAVSAAVIGVGNPIALFVAWKWFDILDTNLWTWLYPPSLMLLAANSSSRGANIVILVLSIATNAGVYFIVAAVFCGLVAGFRRGLHD